ncbi:sugar porter family MFS transporter [Aspergillus stella-maris]|uniref:sugar porter family MFS transporter n=1 Tax=Aspergillus stella-maris TaxID=1810926 RepID=UPI003CCD52A0
MFKGFKASMPSEMTKPLLMVCIYASLGGMGFGMDYNYWSGFLGMAQFARDFGVLNESTGEYYIPSTWQSAATGTPTAGLALGAIVSGFIGNRLGRVKTFFVSAVIGVVGILIQACSFGSYWQFMVGRIVNAVSLGIVCNVVPAYQSECAPYKIRGSLINTYQFSLLVGGTLVHTANWGLHERTDQWAYRAVVILQFIVPIILLIGSFILPESPRWLVGKGRRDDAAKVLHLLRKGTPHNVIEREADLLMLAEEEQASLHGSVSWIDTIRGPNLRRTLIATGMQCMQQTQGSGFMSNYLVVFLQGIGVTDSYRTSVLMTFTNMMSCAFAFYFVDRLGRRPLVLVSTVVMGAAMFSIAGVTGYGDTGSARAQSGALAALFMWQVFQAVGWSSCVWILTAETPTLQLREKTITIASFSGFVVNVLVTYISPFIQDAEYANLQGKIGFIYGSFSVVAFVWAFFMVPELKGRSLEEVDELFEKGVSTLKFGSYVCSGVGAGVTVLEGVKGDDVDVDGMGEGGKGVAVKGVEV